MKLKTDKQNIKKSKGILLLTPFFSPNIGGVETHFDDLVLALDKRGCRVYVQTYSPITTEGVEWKSRQKLGQNIFIRRYRWFGKGFFHKVEKSPVLDFLYLTPYLFIRTFFWLLFNSKKIDVIHAQGLNAAWMGKFYKEFFKKKLLVSTHAIYEIDKNSATAKRIAAILNSADKILTLSKGSEDELISFGVDRGKIGFYDHWVNLESFRPLDKMEFRNKLGLKVSDFVVLFVGRLIEKKGTRVLTEVAKKLPEVKFVFVGLGPDAGLLTIAAKENKNILFLGKIVNDQLYKIYNAADLFCIPSQYEEGFGRVNMEAVACGLPVVGSNKGGIPKALDSSVSILVDPTVENLKNAIDKLHKDKKSFAKLQGHARSYAEEKFGEDNVLLISKYY